MGIDGMLRRFKKSDLNVACIGGSILVAIASGWLLGGENLRLLLARGVAGVTPELTTETPLLLGNTDSRTGWVEGDAVKEGLQDGTRVSVLLSHGFGDEALELLNGLELENDCKSWSEGRLCWYKSLACRLSGEHELALRWKEEAERLGIPELGDETAAFWEQQQHWSSDLIVEFAEFDEPISGIRYVSLMSKADGIAYTAKQMVGEIRKERQRESEDSNKPEHILAKVRLATWKLLLGEYTAFHEPLALWTTSVNSFVDGKQLLQEIEADIDLNPGLERIVSSDPAVAIRLDSARVRLVAIENKEAVSRQEEVDRLHQLREVAKQYRSMADSMLHWQSYFTLNDIGKSNEKARESLQFLRDVQSTVDQRGADFHLFDDEPAVEGESEFSILEIKPTPLSAEPLAQIKSMQAYSLLLAAGKDLNRERASELLDDAEMWAWASLDEGKNVAGVPGGSDAKNLVGRLTLGLVALEKANALSLNPQSVEREKASNFYSKAKATLGELRGDLEGLGYDDTQRIPEQIIQSLELLDNPESSRQKALQLYLAGELETAREELRLATKVHRSAGAALDSIVIGIHAGLPTDDLRSEWEEYLAAEVFSADDVSAALARSQISCLAAGRALATAVKGESTQLVEELTSNSMALRKSANDPNIEKDLRNRVKANLALMQAYRWALRQGNDSNTAELSVDEIKEAYRHARDAEFYFQKKVGADDEVIASLSALQARDALVASRLAAGHLAAMHLDDWRDESKIFLAAAVQQASKLPRVDPILPMLGEPLLKQFYSDVKDGDQKLAAEERQRRQMVTRCIEALFAIRFGSPAAGAQQLTRAVEMGEGAIDLTKVVNASELSASADGFDAKVTLPDTIRAFEVLGLIEAGEATTAFEKAVLLAGGRKVAAADVVNMSDDAAGSCLQGIDSPLVAFTFGAAVEASLADTGVSESLAFKEWLSKQGEAAFQKGQDLLREERLAERYPHLQELVKQKIMEFKSPDSFVVGARQFLLRGRLGKAQEVIENGLAKHVKSSALWRLYFDCKISFLNQSGSDVSDELRTLMGEIENAEQGSLLTAFQANSLAGKVFDLLGDYRKAEVAFRNAASLADSERDRISAASNAERLRILVASVAG